MTRPAATPSPSSRRGARVMTYRRFSLLLAALPLALSQMGATDCGQIIKDPGFDLWCGDRLCDWKVEKGDAQKVPTWHDGDDGVSLVGDDVAIAQMTPVNSDDGTCIEFSMLTDIATDAEVHLQFDVFGDGSVEHDERVPTAHWAPVSFKVWLASPYNGIKFRLTKTGPGQAVLAEIAAKVSSDCPGAQIPIDPRPDGAWCVTGDDCQSGVCNGIALPLSPHPVCGECADDAACSTAGDVCGVHDAVPPHLEPFRGCVASGSRSLGQLCAEDAECTTGICDGVCQGCAAGSCGAGETCDQVSDGVEPQPDGTYLYWPPPRECAPGQGRRQSGETCFADADCASGACNGGVLKICALSDLGYDGRTCSTDLDCPGDGLDPGHCLAVGIAGGTCQ